MATLSLTWKDFNLNEDGFNIYRSETPMDINNMPAPIATVGHNVGSYDDTTGVVGTWYYYRVSVVRGTEEVIGGEIEKYYGHVGPGPQTLLVGDMTDGFFGEVPVEELFSGVELATAIGLTAGTSQHSTEPWLKFAIDDQIVFIAKKTYRHTISWDDINAVNAVYDDANSPVVSAGGYDMKVTLMTGADADPATGGGGEWNRLIYRVHEDVPADQVGDNWAEYTNADISVGSGDGRASWTQETDASDASKRVFRGLNYMSHFFMFYSDYLDSGRGWRPVLRLIV